MCMHACVGRRGRTAQYFHLSEEAIVFADIYSTRVEDDIFYNRAFQMWFEYITGKGNAFPHQHQKVRQEMVYSQRKKKEKKRGKDRMHE